jgi:TIR domain
MAFAMADIFVSYSSKDADIANALASDLQAGGFSVWWDTSLIAGEKFPDVIARELDKAQAVIVIWSPESVKSDWVRWEATRAHDRGVLIPIMTSGVRVRDIPAPFSILRTELRSNRDGIFAALANLGVRRSNSEKRNSAELSEHLVILGILSSHIHRSCAERAVVGKAMAASNQSRQSADSVQPGQLVEAQHLTHFGHLACWRRAPSAETIAH